MTFNFKFESRLEPQPEAQASTDSELPVNNLNLKLLATAVPVCDVGPAGRREGPAPARRGFKLY